MPVGSIKDRSAEQMVDFPAPRTRQRVQRRTADHIVDVPFLHILEEIVEVVRLVPEERVQQRTDEQTVDEQLVEVPLTQIAEEIAEEFKI